MRRRNYVTDWSKHTDDILPIILEIRAVSATLDKATVLLKNKDNELWLRYLYAVYSPDVVYGVSGDKIGKSCDIQNLVLCRSIRAGISVTVINNVYSKMGIAFIPKGAKIMKSKPANLSEVTFPVIGQPKYDGHYTVIVSSVSGLAFYTSGGHAYTLPENHPQLADLRKLEPNVYFAERITTGLLGARRGVSLLGGRDNRRCKESNRFRIFEHVCYGEFQEGKSDRTFKERDEELTRLLAYTDLKAPSVELATLEDAERYLASLLADKYEGIIVRDPDVLWRDSKSRKMDCVKVKPRHTADLYCFGELEGNTEKTQGLIGSLQLKSSTGLRVNVSSGLSQEQRAFWGYFDGQVIEIAYEHKNPDGTYVQPVFIRVREDKAVTDID